jgi:outer membrane protein assembly factor BamB
MALTGRSTRDGPAHPGVNALEAVLDPSTVRGVGQAWVRSVSGDASQPTVVGNVLYVGSSDGKVYALNALTGAVMWTVPTRGSIASSPAVVGGWCTQARATAGCLRHATSAWQVRPPRRRGRRPRGAGR